jgi:hypothetical protein
MAKKMIIKGVGNFLTKRYKADGTGAEIVTLGSLQDLKITLTTEIDDIFGGDGIFAIDTLVKSKSIEVTATDAKFDLNTLRLMNGDAGTMLDTDKYLWILNEQHVVGATTYAKKRLAITNGANADGDITVTIGATPYTVAVLSGDSELAIASAIAADPTLAGVFTMTVLDDVVTFQAKAKNIVTGAVTVSGQGVTGVGTNVQDGTGTTKTITLDNSASAIANSITVRNKTTNKEVTFTNASGVLTLNGVMDDDNVLCSYKKTDNSLTADDFYDILSDSVPFPVHVIHNGVFVQKDGTKAGVETELYQCRAKGAFTIDATRATASTSSVSLTVLDPERADKRLGTIKRFTIA